MSFTLKMSEAGEGSIYIYRDPADIKFVAVAPDAWEPWAIVDASSFDPSSRSRHLEVGDAAVLRNISDVWAVVVIDPVETRHSSFSGRPSLRFHYAIQPDRSANFTNLRP